MAPRVGTDTKDVATTESGGSINGLPVATSDQLVNFAFINARAMDIVRENLGGQTMTAADFERIKFPTGGGKFWTMPSLDGDGKPTKEIIGIVLMYRSMRQYWEKEFTGEGAPPDCICRDLTVGVGVGTPGGDCSKCPLNEWGSGKKSTGKACKEVGALFVMVPGETLPVIVPVPVTSQKNIKKFMLNLSSKNIRYPHTILGLGLIQDKSKGDKDGKGGGIEYSMIKPRLIAILPKDAEAQINTYIAEFKAAMSNATISQQDATAH
jgi:hypothetical protein